MKTLAICGLFVFVASGLFAQRHAVGTTAGTNAGYGNVVFPGGRPAITTPFTQTNTNFGKTTEKQGARVVELVVRFIF